MVSIRGPRSPDSAGHVGSFLELRVLTVLCDHLDALCAGELAYPALPGCPAILNIVLSGVIKGILTVNIAVVNRCTRKTPNAIT